MFARVPFAQPDLSPHLLNGPYHPVKRRPTPKTVVSDCMADLARIYEDDVNLCLIRRPLPEDIEVFAHTALDANIRLETSRPVDPRCFDFSLIWPEAAGIPGYQSWTADIALLAGAFCELFGRREAGLRLRTLDKAMCPRFHVDSVAARMICSYGGSGTEWLPENALDRSKLGMGSGGQPDAQSGLMTDPAAIKQMPVFAVGLMKGEHWEGNEGRGLAHRSPMPADAQPRRLLLTLDML
ncbi:MULTISPECIES: DUF1826 domain-containing protein [Methylomicrobium]|uniref:Succinylglutamate desuccinylase n=1 Tax=Methylomicrobium album BG8 TaxID=686340 RepID=H8GK13_METAL|nr:MULTISPECIES: DUF1826 domain-containing protein [Methylomicrobium]EIC27972.1 Protein of unknown function (DUF1826) [Methylomicrobium album BG8]